MFKRTFNPADAPHQDAILKGLAALRTAKNDTERTQIKTRINEAGRQLSTTNRNGR